MATVERTVPAGADRVFEILADGWTYSDWVVGTAHIRDVDESWPEPGSQLHHRAGPWPFSIEDRSTVTAVTPGRSLTLKAGLWPFGEATVVLDIHPIGEDRCRVVIHEDFHAGPLNWVQNKLNDLVLHRRNVESLRRLSDIAERSAGLPGTGKGK